MYNYTSSGAIDTYISDALFAQGKSRFIAQKACDGEECLAPLGMTSGVIRCAGTDKSTPIFKATCPILSALCRPISARSSHQKDDRTVFAVCSRSPFFMALTTNSYPFHAKMVCAGNQPRFATSKG